MLTRAQWRLFWLLWAVTTLLIIAGSFGLLEWLAWDAGGTLSYTAATMPPYGVFIVGWLSGGITCGLAVHFWWHWSPSGKGGNHEL